jgi:hypothetical protein
MFNFAFNLKPLPDRCFGNDIAKGAQSISKAVQATFEVVTDKSKEAVSCFIRNYCMNF